MERALISKKVTVTDTDNSLVFQALIQYPATLQNKHPLVILSHGSGGSHLIYRTISSYLAKNGFVVAMPEHFGNNRSNNTLAESVLNLQYRPRHISLTIDFVLNNPIFAAHIDADKIAVIGHSFGGYAALAVAGGTPWTKERLRVDVQHDARVKALVLLAPAAPFFLAPNALKHVHIPILMYTAQKDAILSAEYTAGVVLQGVPDPFRVTHRVVENAGHFSFISPFPKSLKSASFLPSIDPEGFDREAFHRVLPAEILAYLQQVFM